MVRDGCSIADKSARSESILGVELAKGQLHMAEAARERCRFDAYLHSQSLVSYTLASQHEVNGVLLNG